MPSIAVVSFNVSPSPSLTYKYERLGPMAIENHRQYCRRHGYNFVEPAPAVTGRPVCWAKIPAVLEALESYEWVMWADSDTLVWDQSVCIESLLDETSDMVVHSPREHFACLGVDRELATEIMPINTAVFILRSSAWSRALLCEAYDQTFFVSDHEIWNGVGDQEAITSVLRRRPRWVDHVRSVDDLAGHPRFASRGRLFAHFYGNHARHRLSPATCEAVIARWEAAVAGEQELPSDVGRFHWSCIQNKQPDSPVQRGGPDSFFYRPDEVDSGRMEAVRAW